jgi:hypothetical protein
VSDRVESLSLPERIEVYRQRAARMLRLARQCDSQGVRLAYLKLAAHWQDLIVELEKGRAVLPEQIRKTDLVEPSRSAPTKNR